MLFVTWKGESLKSKWDPGDLRHLRLSQVFHSVSVSNETCRSLLPILSAWMAMSPEGHGKASVLPNNKLPRWQQWMLFLTSRLQFYHWPADTSSDAKLLLELAQTKSGSVVKPQNKRKQKNRKNNGSGSTTSRKKYKSMNINDLLFIGEHKHKNTTVTV